VGHCTSFERMGLRRETKADGPFVVGDIMVDEAIKEGDVGSVGRSTEGSGTSQGHARDTREKENEPVGGAWVEGISG
jgi:hypothetical protein